jgi:hypothetical protein
MWRTCCHPLAAAGLVQSAAAGRDWQSCGFAGGPPKLTNCKARGYQGSAIRSAALDSAAPRSTSAGLRWLGPSAVSVARLARTHFPSETEAQSESRPWRWPPKQSLGASRPTQPSTACLASAPPLSAVQHASPASRANDTSTTPLAFPSLRRAWGLEWATTAACPTPCPAHT